MLNKSHSVIVILERYKRLTFGCFLLLGVVLYLYYLGPKSNTLTPTQISQHESEHGELYSIGYLVVKYKSSHDGKAPTRISELASYDDYNNAWPNAYTLPSRPNSSDIIAFEKPGLWSDGTVAVCYTDLTIKRLTLAEFSALGLEQFAVQ